MSKTHHVRHNEAANRFESGTGGRLALLAYKREADSLSLLHTEVPDELEGQGVGSALAREALEYARAERLRVRPYCQFVASWIKKHPDYRDVVDADF